MRFSTDMAEDIVSYPEYEEFIEKLARFHEERGSLFRAEPILGGKKIDLCLLYKLVTERGGMDKVSEERRWRRIGEEFQLPETCTSSAYVLKDVYQRYLKEYETVMFSMNNNTNTNSTNPSTVISKKSEHQMTNDMLPTPNLSMATTFSDPMKMTHVPSSTLTSHSSMTATLLGVKSTTPKLIHDKKMSVSSSSDTSTISFTSNNSSLPRNWTILEMEEKLKLKAEKSFRASRRQLMYQPRTLLRDGQNKIRLALLSKLKPEIDWGLRKLIALSYVCEEEFALNDIPDLLDVLMQCIDDFLWELEDRQSYDPLYGRSNVKKPIICMDYLIMNSDEDIMETTRCHYDLSLLLQDSELLRRSLEVILILRNFSVMEVNKRLILNHTKARLFIYKGALVQGNSDIEELRMRSMDILESLASYYKLSGPQDILLEILIHYLMSGDRARIVTALYILLDLTAHQRNDESLLGSIGHETFWSALYTLVLSSDTDLKEMIEEILYRLSQIDESLERHIISGHPLTFNFRRLIEQRSIGLDKTFLTHHNLDLLLPPFSSSIIFSTLSSINSMTNDIWQSWTPQISSKFSDHSPSMDVTLNNNARDWLKHSFEEAPNFLVQYPRMYWAYVEAIQGQSRDSRNPIMDEKSFLPLLHSLFPDSALQFLRRQNHSEYFISGIRVRQQKI